MKERPILFNGDMVRAILDGRKTQTRRPVKPQPEPIPEDVWKDKRVPSERQFWWPSKKAGQMVELRDMALLAPLGTVGDQLWVRETWRMDAYNIAAEYRASTSALMEHIAPWKPSIHMPRWASRIDLEITRVWVERVQDITEEDAKREGVKVGEDRSYSFAEHGLKYEPHKDAFRDLWQSIYGTWDANPWVWAYEFRRIKP